MAKSFTEIEKGNIRAKLLQSCEHSWSKFGYRKTNIDELCAKAGISKGAFYLFYNSKEELFCDTLEKVQNRLYGCIEDTLAETPTKEGFAKALKLGYREYDQSSFLYDIHSADFNVFTNKLSKEQTNRISENSIRGSHILIDKPYLKLKIDKHKALSIISVLMSTISCKDHVLCDHLEVFDFLVDNVIGEIFE